MSCCNKGVDTSKNLLRHHPGQLNRINGKESVDVGYRHWVMCGGPCFILVTHDMNIYPMADHLLGETIEDHDAVEHMDVIDFF